MHVCSELKNASLRAILLKNLMSMDQNPFISLKKQVQ